MIEIEVGMTCRLGKSKTAVQWEVIGYLEAEQRVNLSKLGGDGYVNKSAALTEIIDLQPRLLDVCLIDVLEKQRSVRALASSISDRARFFAHAEEASTIGTSLCMETLKFRQAVDAYQYGIAEHYPHLTTQKEN